MQSRGLVPFSPHSCRKRRRCCVRGTQLRQGTSLTSPSCQYQLFKLCLKRSDSAIREAVIGTRIVGNRAQCTSGPHPPEFSHYAWCPGPVCWFWRRRRKQSITVFLLRWEFQPQLNELIHLSPFPNDRPLDGRMCWLNFFVSILVMELKEDFLHHLGY